MSQAVRKGPSAALLLIFDLDGTLIDSLEDIAASVNRTLVKFHLPVLPTSSVRQNVGIGARRLMHTIVEEIQTKGVPAPFLFEEVFESFLQDYGEHLLDTTTLYPGVSDTLNHFSNKTLVVVTNKPDFHSNKILQGLGIAPLFSKVWGGDSGFKLKPEPETLLMALQLFQMGADRAMIVGDSPVDIEAGKKAGIHTCAVTYGLRDKAELAKARPDFLIDQFSTLREIVT